MKSLPNFCHIINKKFNSTTDPIVYSTNTILAHSDRMIYFRENSNNKVNSMVSVYNDALVCGGKTSLLTWVHIILVGFLNSFTNFNLTEYNILKLEFLSENGCISCLDMYLFVHARNSYLKYYFHVKKSMKMDLILFKTIA